MFFFFAFSGSEISFGINKVSIFFFSIVVFGYYFSYVILLAFPFFFVLESSCKKAKQFPLGINNVV